MRRKEAATAGEEPVERPAALRTRERYGYYVWADVQPWARWVLGTRYDWTELPGASGHEWAIGPYVSLMPSEFLRFRLGYEYTERSGVEGPTSLNELLFETTFVLGAHPAHPF